MKILKSKEFIFEKLNINPINLDDFADEFSLVKNFTYYDLTVPGNLVIVAKENGRKDMYICLDPETADKILKLRKIEKLTGTILVHAFTMNFYSQKSISWSQSTTFKNEFPINCLTKDKVIEVYNTNIDLSVINNKSQFIKLYKNVMKAFKEYANNPGLFEKVNTTPIDLDNPIVNSIDILTQYCISDLEDYDILISYIDSEDDSKFEAWMYLSNKTAHERLSEFSKNSLLRQKILNGYDIIIYPDLEGIYGFFGKAVNQLRDNIKLGIPTTPGTRPIHGLVQTVIIKYVKLVKSYAYSGQFNQSLNDMNLLDIYEKTDFFAKYFEIL